MNSKEIHQFIRAELERGASREDIARALEERAGADHLGTNFKLAVAQYASIDAFRRYKILVGLFAVAAMLFAGLELFAYVISLIHFLKYADNGGIWLIMQPLLMLSVALCSIQALRMQHIGLFITSLFLIMFSANLIQMAPALAVVGFVIAGFGMFLRAMLFPHLTWLGKPR